MVKIETETEYTRKHAMTARLSNSYYLHVRRTNIYRCHFYLKNANWRFELLFYGLNMYFRLLRLLFRWFSDRNTFEGL